MEFVKEASDFVFHRDFTRNYPRIQYGKGVYLYDHTGKRYLDASSGAVAVNLGHGLTEIADAMADQAKKAAFVHTLRFETDILFELAAEIIEMMPPTMRRVYFTSGGSEANESAIKLARQYHRDRGKKEKSITIGRWQSYHGNTLGSLSAGGDIKRRQAFTPMLLGFQHLYSPYCLRCPYQKEYASCKENNRLECAEDLERLVIEIGPEYISSFICEPIVGSQQGAVVPPEEYLKRVREICDKYDILLIVDEVMTGFGRTGTNFAIDQFGVVPDIITFGKGISSGYAPLAGMIVSEKLIDSLIQHGNGRFSHGYTYSGHPVSVAAGLAAVRFYKQHNVLANCVEQGIYLMHKLKELQNKHQMLGDIRGRGLLIGIELMRDREKNLHYQPSDSASEKLNQIAMEYGAVFYPGSGTIDGKIGDHILITPPLTINRSEIDEIIKIFDKALITFQQDELSKT